MAKSNPRRAIIREWASVACPRETTIHPTGERFCGGTPSAPSSASYHADHRTMSSWHGCVRALDGLENNGRIKAAGKNRSLNPPLK